MNLGPKLSSCNKLSICHWNLNSIFAQDFIELFLLRAYISVHNFDIFFLVETYLDSTISSNNSNLIIPDYDLYWADHPSNVKRGGICIYYNFVALYHSPSQFQDEFETFTINLELNLDTISVNNPFFVLVDFNVKPNLWYKNDKTTNEGSKIDRIASQYGLNQLKRAYSSYYEHIFVY